MTIIAAADGSALGNPGPAGWAWYIDDANWAAGGWKHATNNQGELMAVLELFRSTAGVDDDLLILCDSQYVINCITKWMAGWKRKGWRKGDGKPVMNVDLLKLIDEAIVGRRYRFEWVKGHVGHELNEAADARARAVAEAFQRGTTVPSGPGFTRAARPLAAAGTAATATGSASSSPIETTPASPSPSIPVATNERVGPTTEDLTPSLFSWDAEEETTRQVTVTLSGDEYERLSARARAEGTSPERFLRGLI